MADQPQHEWLKSLLQCKHSDNTSSPSYIAQILDVENEAATVQGENFVGELQRYRITVRLNNGERVVKRVIVKVQPKGAQFCDDTSGFKIEVFMYSVVLKGMEAVMKEFNDKRNKMWCSFLGYREYDQIALEDLRVKDFKMKDRLEMLDYEHSEFAIKALARFHAMSVIVIKRGIAKPTDFKHFMFVSNKRLIDMFLTCFFYKFAEIVKEKWGPEWSDLPERLNKAGKESVTRFTEMGKFDKSRFNVINHGDCWTTNLMFKHDPVTNVPTDLKFVDYQLSHYNSFGWDLTYILYNGTQPHIRRTKYQELIQVYYKELKQSLTMYSYQEEAIPTLDYILDEMERLKFFGFGMLISVQAFTSSEVKNAYDLHLAYQNADPSVGINTDIFISKKFRNKVEDDIRAFMEQGIL